MIFSRNGNFNQRVEKLTLHQRFRFQRRDCVTYCNSGCYQCGHTSYRGIQPHQFLLSTDKVFGEKKWRHWTTEFPKRIYLIITLYLIILYESIVFIMHQSFMLNIPLFIIYDFFPGFLSSLGITAWLSSLKPGCFLYYPTYWYLQVISSKINYKTYNYLFLMQEHSFLDNFMISYHLESVKII